MRAGRLILLRTPLDSSTGEWWGADDNCVVASNATDRSFLGLKTCRPDLGVFEECTNKTSSAAQFWEKYVLNITPALPSEFGDVGGFEWKLPLALLLSWCVVFLCLMKGVKSSGKVRLIGFSRVNEK